MAPGYPQSDKEQAEYYKARGDRLVTKNSELLARIEELEKAPGSAAGPLQTNHLDPLRAAIKAGFTIPEVVVSRQMFCEIRDNELRHCMVCPAVSLYGDVAPRAPYRVMGYMGTRIVEENSEN